MVRFDFVPVSGELCTGAWRSVHNAEIANESAVRLTLQQIFLRWLIVLASVRRTSPFEPVILHLGTQLEDAGGRADLTLAYICMVLSATCVIMQTE
eukprot:6178514-Pleurochrysis_carterae.AAC.1